jgi:hypothetical protein
VVVLFQHTCKGISLEDFEKSANKPITPSINPRAVINNRNLWFIHPLCQIGSGYHKNWVRYCLAIAFAHLAARSGSPSNSGP